MAQQTWDFKDQFGIDHQFGIYHGEDSGHFVGYLDQNIMFIDFKIIEDKEFNFYVNHELMKFKISKDPSGDFTYSLAADTESNTPYNNYIKKNENEYKKHIWWGIIALLLIVKLIVYFITRKYH